MLPDSGSERDSDEEPTVEYLPDLLKTQLAGGGDRPAVVVGPQTITYAELDDSSGRLAHWLTENAASRHVIVLCSHALDDVVAHLAALRAGKVLVPLDAREPAGRIRRVESLLGCDVVLGAEPELVPGLESVLAVRDVLARAREVAEWTEWSPDEPAWIHFTSGSTGEPRGTPVDLKRRLPKNFMRGLVDEKSLVAVARPLPFVAGANALFNSLASGARVDLVDVAGIDSSEFFVDIATRGVTHLTLPISLLRSSSTAQYLERNSSIVDVHVSGERCLNSDLQTLRRVFPKARIHNSYGSSELGVIAQLTILPHESIPPDPVPAGTPFDCSVVVVDDEGRTVGSNEIGALAVISRQRTAGYLTPGGLVSLDEVVTDDGSTAVLTGDTGYLDADGVLVVLGRRDDFVKVNGQLVNPGVVEAALSRHPDIVDVVVVPFSGHGGRTRLGAVVEMRDGASVSSRDLRLFLAGDVPSYMIPARMIVDGPVPRGTRGKADRVKLTEAFSKPVGESQLPEIGDPITWKITTCLGRFVDTSRMTTMENLQYCGLDSLDAVEFTEMLSRTTKVPIPLSLLVGEWSLSSLREWILSYRTVTRPRVVPIVEGSNPTKLLWVIPGSNLLLCLPLASGLDGYSSMVLVPRGVESREAPLIGTDAIARDLFTEYLRTVCDPNVAVVGFSAAAWIAHRLARLMVASGMSPRLLVMIDPASLAWINGPIPDPDPSMLMRAREGELAYEASSQIDVSLLAMQVHGLRHHDFQAYQGRSLVVLREGREEHEVGISSLLRDPEVVRCAGPHLELVRDPSRCGPAIRRSLDEVTGLSSRS